MKQKQFGFTLIELLIVIGIIAALAAILFPVFFSVRAKGRQTVCVSNLRQLGIAAFQYAGDADDHYPYGGDPGDLNTNGWNGTEYEAQINTMKAQNSYLYNVMGAYVGSKELWHCPADTGFDRGGIQETIPMDAHPTAFQAYGMSYAYSTLLGLQHQTLTGVQAWGQTPPYSEHDYSNIPLLSDLSGHWHGGANREDGRFNMVMLDGHVITVQRDRFVDLQLILFRLPPPPAKP